MDTFSLLPDLLLVARLGSFTAAAHQLGVPRSTVSRRLARLEEDVGKRLLDRTTRSLRLTDAGRELVESCQSHVLALEHAVDAVRQRDDVPRGVLRVAIPPGLGRGFWADFVAGFRREYPLVRLVAVHTTERLHLLEDDFDVILQEDPEGSTSWLSRTISPAGRFLVASPAYLKQRGSPATVSDLHQHDCLVYDTTPRARVPWPLRRGGTVDVKPVFATNDRSMVLDVCLSGGGIALLSMVSTSLDLLSGRLVPVLAADVGAEGRLVALFAARSNTVPKVRALLDYIDDVVLRTAPNLDDVQT